jgi:hypothetical protein
MNGFWLGEKYSVSAFEGREHRPGAVAGVERAPAEEGAAKRVYLYA